VSAYGLDSPSNDLGFGALVDEVDVDLQAGGCLFRLIYSVMNCSVGTDFSSAVHGRDLAGSCPIPCSERHNQDTIERSQGALECLPYLILINKGHWTLQNYWSHQLRRKYGGLRCSDSVKAAVSKFSSLQGFHRAAYM